MKYPRTAAGYAEYLGSEHGARERVHFGHAHALPAERKPGQGGGFDARAKRNKFHGRGGWRRSRTHMMKIRIAIPANG